MTTTAKSVERALHHAVIALERDHVHPQHPGAHSHLVAARVQLEAVARLLLDAA